MENPLLALRPFSDTSTSRLQSLYSDISRQKFSNPDSYQTNITWWHTALQELVWSGLQPPNGRAATPNRLSLNAGMELVDALKLQGVGKPLAIGHIVVSKLLCNQNSITYQHLSARLN
jgi:charged multivesicular body protein 7